MSLFWRLALLVVAIVAASAVPVRAAIALGPGAIVATVLDPSGRPVAGARVSALGPAEREGLTGNAGLLTLQALPFGSYAVRVMRSGFEPFDALVRVTSASVPVRLAARLTAATFTSLREGIPASLATPLDAGSDPYVAHALEAAPGTAVAASPAGAGAGIAIDGALPGESRVEVDGIPIAGGAQGFNAMRFRNAVMLDEISLARGPLTDTPTVRDTIGGIIDYRTPALTEAASGGLAAGYDSAFGAFQHARYTQAFGPLGVLFDAVTGGGENRAQTLKARLDLSRDVSLAVASYGSQSRSDSGIAVTSDAPAFAADLRASLGAGALRVRSFQSEARTYADGEVTLENASVRGLQVAYDLPAGRNIFALAYDRRAEATTFGDGSVAVQTFDALGVRGAFALSAASRLELADSLDRGTTFAVRNDPRIAYTLRSSPALTLRLVAGSAYATEPADAFATAALANAARAPETSFGLRIRADASLGNGLTVWGAAFGTRRFDRPAGLPDARTAGIELGLNAPAFVNRFGVNAYVDMQHGIPATLAATYFDGVPATKARVALQYRFSGGSIDYGTTFLGAGNAFSGHAVMLGDVAVRLPLFHFADARIGIENLYGTQTPIAALAPLFVPREFTLTVGRTSGN